MGLLTYPRGENRLVIDTRLNPRHEMLDIFRRGHLGGFPVLPAVLPEILKLVGGLHFGTFFGGAKLGDGAVEEVDLIIKIDNYSPYHNNHIYQLSRPSSHRDMNMSLSPLQNWLTKKLFKGGVKMDTTYH